MPAEQVRLAGPSDASDVARLLAEFRAWWGKEEPSEDAMRAVVERLLDDPQTEFLLAGEPAVAVCQLRYRLSVWTGVEDCWLEDLYVGESARGAGLGRALVEEAVARAGSRGCRRIELDVNEDNEAALALYLGAGFTLTPKPPGRTLFVSRSL